MYPIMIDQAIEEQSARAEKSFEWANDVEKIHYDLFQGMLKAVKEKQTLKDEAYYVFPVCGNTVLGAAPDKCPICNTPGSRWKRIA